MPVSTTLLIVFVICAFVLAGYAIFLVAREVVQFFTERKKEQEEQRKWDAQTALDMPLEEFVILYKEDCRTQSDKFKKLLDEMEQKTKT